MLNLTQLITESTESTDFFLIIIIILAGSWKGSGECLGGNSETVICEVLVGHTPMLLQPP